LGVYAIAAALLTAYPLMPVQARPANDAANMAAAKATFGGKCAMCHGPDGAGSEVGKSMNVPDIRSATIQKLPNTELTEVITNGKNGMPPFKGSLNAGQINELVVYIRSLATKK
jgi:mono/diheme cytochrome c family protein